MKKGTKSFVMVLVVLAIVAGLGFIVFKVSQPQSVVITTPSGQPVVSGCPTDGDTSLKIDVKNIENTTGSEGFDITGYLYKKVGNGYEYVGSIADTTSPTATTIDCGYSYLFKPISASAESGDNSRIQTIISGDAQIVDGNLEFTASSSNVNIIAGISQHATVEVRAYDNILSANVYDTGDGSATNYETTGAVFASTTNNETKYDETAGLDMTFSVRATNIDTDFNDRGFYILLDNFDLTVWDANTVAVDVNGVRLSNAKSSFNADEASAYTGYDYAFFVDQKVLDATGEIKIRVYATLASGVTTTSADPTVYLAGKGGYLSTDGVNVKVGSVKDDTTKTAVHTLQSWSLDSA